MSCDPHVGDTPTFSAKLIDCSTDGPLDLTGATTTELKFIKPNGATIVKTATVITDGTLGTDAVIEAQLSATEFDVEGQWYVQPYVVLPSWTGHLSKVRVQALPPIF